jgi:hypothetical protein
MIKKNYYKKLKNEYIKCAIKVENSKNNLIFKWKKSKILRNCIRKILINKHKITFNIKFKKKININISNFNININLFIFWIKF